MHPILFQFTLPILNKEITIYTYGFLVAIGFLVAVYLTAYRAKKYNIKKDVIFDLGFYVILSGIICARLLFVAVNWEQFKDNLIEILYVHKGGIVFYGGFIGGFLTVIIYSKFKKIELLKICDLIAPQIPLAHAFGRLGCFSYGCCFGKITTIKWLGVKFPVNSPAYIEQLNKNLITPDYVSSLPVIPTQLLELYFLIFLFFILLILAKKITKSGIISSAYLILYSLWRFVIEFYRGDDRGSFILNIFSISQFISILLFIIGFIICIKAFKKK